MALTPNQQRLWTEAKAAGYDDEAARVAVAIAQAEGLDATAPGDQGHSVGIWQFYFGEPPRTGAGNAWASVLGLPWRVAQALLAQDPWRANEWWLKGELGGAIDQGRKLGLTGPSLALWAGRAAERPAEGNEVHYAQAYERIWGSGVTPSPVDTPGSPPAPAVPIPGPAPAPDTPGPADPSGLPWWLRDDQTPEIPPASSPDAAAISGAVAGLASALGPFAALVTPGSNPFVGTWSLLLKILATIFAAILILWGIIRATGTEGVAKGVAVRAATGGVAA